jgi:hypothetical protein
MNMRDYPTLHLDTIKVKEQLVVRKDMDVNEHERLSLCLSVMLDCLSCSFTSISFLTTSCSFTLIVSKCNVG